MFAALNCHDVFFKSDGEDTQIKDAIKIMDAGAPIISTTTINTTTENIGSTATAAVQEVAAAAAAAAVEDETLIRTCKCVDCEEDAVCGGLWRANRYPGMVSSVEEAIHKKLHIVVSHCNTPLNWMSGYLNGFTNVASIHVISKCGHEVEGAPMGATTVVLPNVGRCDHTYAYFITTILPTLATSKDDNSIVIFLKDTTTEEFEHQDPGTEPKSLVHIASSSNGFACGVTFDSMWAGSWSPYHDKDTLFTFDLESYREGSTADEVPFRVGNKTLGDFYNSLNVTRSAGSVVQVCYGGIFAASTANIFKQDMRVWKTIEKALERGDNIQEGHYMERSWGILLATPLKAFQIEAMKKHSTKVRYNPDSIHGALLREGGKEADNEDKEYGDDEDVDQQQQIKEEEELSGDNWEVFHFYVLASVGVISAVSVIAFTLSIGTTGRQRGELGIGIAEGVECVVVYSPNIH